MSRRLAALNFLLRHAARPLIAGTRTPGRARSDLALAAWALFRMPRGAAMRELVLGGVPVLEIAPPSAAGAAILYFHGGGYIAGSPRTHRGMLARLALLSGIRVLAPAYRLAPEAPAPAAFEDAVRVWRHLAVAAATPARTVIGGDSAGGGLALALLAEATRLGLPPAGAFAFAPWTDLALTGASIVRNAATDVLLPAARIAELQGMVLAGMPAGDPRVSPLCADFTGAPPVYLQVGDGEILCDDTLRMAERLRGQGVEVRVDRWRDVPHVFQIFDGWIPEAREALGRAAAFARARLRTPTPGSGS